MYGFGPISAAPYCAFGRVAVPDPHYLFVGAAWRTRGVGYKELPVDADYETLGLVGEILRQEVRWNSHGTTFDELMVDARWVTSTVGGELMLDGRWTTSIPATEELPSEEIYSVSGVLARELPLDGRWDTDGQPQQVLLADGRWITIGLTLQTVPAWALWQTFAPTLSFGLCDARWAIFVPEIAELPVDGLWRFNVAVARALTILYGSSLARALTIRYQLGRDRVANDLVIPLPMLVRVARGCRIRYDIRDVDEIRSELVIPYSLLDGSVIDGTPVPTVTVRGETFKAQDCEVGMDEGDFIWTARLGLRDPALLALFGENEPFTVTIGTDTYSFIRDQPSFERNGQVSFVVNVTGVSPGAAYADPRSERITKTWTDATLASAVLAEIIADPVTLEDVIDWSIPGGRLAAESRSPIDIAKQIAAATGAVLESEIDGALTIRPLTPVPVPEWATTAPDFTYDDLRDDFRISEETALRRLANAIRILDGAADSIGGVLAIEVDAREHGLNDGRTEFIPGDRPGLLIFTTSDVDLDRVRASAGSVVNEDDGTITTTEDLDFANATEARLRYPTAALDDFEWLGNDLGTPTLVGETQVQIAEAGVGILRVTYTSAYLARRVANVPATLGDGDEFDVLVVAEGSR